MLARLENSKYYHTVGKVYLFSQIKSRSRVANMFTKALCRVHSLGIIQKNHGACVRSGPVSFSKCGK